MDMPRCATLALLVALAACGRESSGEKTGDAPTVRDSAGITIVDNTDVDPATLARWTVDTIPSVTIGATAGDSAYELAVIGDVRQLPNGMILVMDGQGESAFKFRFYDSAGSHIATHGRLGQGPGEYQWVNFVGPVGGDTVIGVDFPNSRLNWVSASKGYLRSARLDINGFKKLLGDDAYGMIETMVPLGDSMYAVKAFRPMQAAVSRAQRSQSYHIVDLAAGKSFDAGRHDDPPSKAVQLSSGRNNYVTSPSAGIPAHVVDRARGRICVVVTNVTEIACIDRAGKRSSIRWRDDVVPYTDEDRRAADENARRQWTTWGRGRPNDDFERMLAAREVPVRHPPIAAFETDIEGNFWVLESILDSAGKRQTRFRIIAPDGRLAAFADPFPTGNIRVDQPIHIGSDAVLRVIETADGAPAVGVFRIRKP